MKPKIYLGQLSKENLVFSSKTILLLLWVLVFLNLRPGIVGESLMIPLLLVLLGLSFIYRIIAGNRLLSLVMDKNKLIVFGIWGLLNFYLLFQGVALSTAKIIVVQQFIVNAIVFASITLVVSENTVEQILRLFVKINFYLCLCALVTYLIFVVVGGNIYDIPVLKKLGLYGKFNDGSQLLHHRVIFFPFTICWSGINIMGFGIPRFIAIYKEPGIAQFFLSTALFITYFIRFRNPLIIRAFLIFGTVVTFSTAGLLSLALGYLYLYRNSFNLVSFIKSLFVKPLRAVVFIVILYLGAEVIISNLIEEFSNVSGITRLNSYARGIEMLFQKPILGFGYYYGFELDTTTGALVSEATNGILGLSFQLGLIGVFLYLFSAYQGVFRFGNKETLPIYIPYFFTVATSQPTFNIPLTALLIMIPLQHYKLLTKETISG